MICFHQQVSLMTICSYISYLNFIGIKQRVWMEISDLKTLLFLYYTKKGNKEIIEIGVWVLFKRRLEVAHLSCSIQFLRTVRFHTIRQTHQIWRSHCLRPQKRWMSIKQQQHISNARLDDSKIWKGNQLSVYSMILNIEHAEFTNPLISRKVVCTFGVHQGQIF